MILNKQQQQLWRRPGTVEKKVSGNWRGIKCAKADLWEGALWSQLGNWSQGHLFTPDVL